MMTPKRSQFFFRPIRPFVPRVNPAMETDILDLLLSEANVLPLEAADSLRLESRERQLQTIRQSIRRDEPIPMVILGFPAKSPNREKTLTEDPDLGEVEGLKRLDALCARVRRLYPRGAKIVVCSDGHVFSDLVGVADRVVDRYQQTVCEIIEQFRLSTLSTFSLTNVYGTKPCDLMRAKLMGDFGEPLEEIRVRSKSDPAAGALFNGIHRFLFEDMAVADRRSSRSQVRNRAKGVAYQVVQRSQAFSRLVEERFPSAVRLSIHPQPSSSWKIGVRLLPSDDRWATPWHNVALRDYSREGNLRLVPRREAIRLGAELKCENGFAYFELPGGA